MSINHLAIALTSRADALLPLLLDAALKGAVLLAVAGTMVLLLRRASAATRHALWALAVTGLLVLPLMAALLPAWRVLPAWMQPTNPPAVATPVAPIVNPPAANVAESPAPPSASPPDARMPDPLIDDQGPDLGAVSRVPPVLTPAPTGHAISPTSPIAPPASNPEVSSVRPRITLWSGVVLIWLAGAIILLARLALAAVLLHCVGRSAAPMTDPGWVELHRKRCGQLGLRRRPLLFQSTKCSRTGVGGMPMTWGVIRPRILVPAEANAWPADRRQVVLVHELAHIKRRDCLTQTIAQLACALHWFNPLAWLACRQMAALRERACDDQVLAFGSQAGEYAQTILQIAGRFRTPVLAAAGGIAMARASSLEGRLLAILDPRRNRRALTRWGLLGAAILIAAIATPLAIMRARAADSPPVSTVGQNSLPATQPAAQRSYRLDVTDETMQNIVSALHRECGLPVSFENLDFDQNFDQNKDAITLGAALARLEAREKTGPLTPMQKDRLQIARKQIKDGMSPKSLFDLGQWYSRQIAATSADDLLTQVTADTPYTFARVAGQYIIGPRAPSLLRFPVTLNTAGMTLMESVNKVLAQRPGEGRIDFSPMYIGPSVPGYDPMPWLKAKAPALDLKNVPAIEALTRLTAQMAPPLVWELAGMKGSRTLGVVPAPRGTQPATPATQPAGSTLEFRIAPKPGDLDKAELASYMDWLKAGKTGFWWKDGRVAGISGRMPDHAWLPLADKSIANPGVVTGEYQGQTYLLVSDKPGQFMARGQGGDAWGFSKLFKMRDWRDRPALGFELDDRGTEMFTTLTNRNVGGNLAIVVDGQVLAAPQLMTALGKSGQIFGNFTEQQIDDLIKSLKLGMPAVKAGGATRSALGTEPVDRPTDGELAAILAEAMRHDPAYAQERSAIAPAVAEREYLRFLRWSTDKTARAKVYFTLGHMFSAGADPALGGVRDEAKARDYFTAVLREQPEGVCRETLWARTMLASLEQDLEKRVALDLENYKYFAALDEATVRRNLISMLPPGETGLDGERAMPQALEVVKTTRENTANSIVLTLANNGPKGKARLAEIVDTFGRDSEFARLAFAILLGPSGAVSTSQPATQPAADWGPASAGVQARLRPGDSATRSGAVVAWKSGEVPAFFLEIRNGGNVERIVPVHQTALRYLAIDGTDYFVKEVTGPVMGHIAPGQQHAPIPVWLTRPWVTLDDKPLVLKPGPHTIQIDFDAEATDYAPDKRVRVTSNPVTFAIVAASATIGTQPGPAVTMPGEAYDDRVERLLDLAHAPRTTNSAKLPDLWEESPPGSHSHELRPGVIVGRHPQHFRFGDVYYVPDKDLFYVQHDSVLSSTTTFYGPFKGQPWDLLQIPESSRHTIPPWGQLNGGVQARLEGNRGAWPQGEAPDFHVDIRNLGTVQRTLAESDQLGELVIDGSPYRYAGEIRLKSSPFPPGQVLSFPVTLSKDWQVANPPALGRSEAGPANSALVLKPGKHSLAARFFPEAEGGGARNVVVESNTVEFEIAAAANTAPAAGTQPAAEASIDGGHEFLVIDKTWQVREYWSQVLPEFHGGVLHSPAEKQPGDTKELRYYLAGTAEMWTNIQDSAGNVLALQRTQSSNG